MEAENASDQKAKDDSRFERMQRMLAEKQARRQRDRTATTNKKNEPASSKKQQKDEDANPADSEDTSTKANRNQEKEEPKEATSTNNEEKEENEEEKPATSNKSMTAFEKMQARMASRQKERKEVGGPKASQATKKAVKVQKKIDPLKNTKPLIIRNSKLRDQRVDIVDIPMSDRQSVDRSFEVGNLVYFVSKDDSQYVSGTLSEFKNGGFCKIEKNCESK